MDQVFPQVPHPIPCWMINVIDCLWCLGWRTERRSCWLPFSKKGIIIISISLASSTYYLSLSRWSRRSKTSLETAWPHLHSIIIFVTIHKTQDKKKNQIYNTINRPPVESPSTHRPLLSSGHKATSNTSWNESSSSLLRDGQRQSRGAEAIEPERVRDKLYLLDKVEDLEYLTTLKFWRCYGEYNDTLWARSLNASSAVESIPKTLIESLCWVGVGKL